MPRVSSAHPTPSFGNVAYQAPRDPTQTPRRVADPTQTPHRPHVDPTQTPHRINLGFTVNKPRAMVLKCGISKIQMQALNMAFVVFMYMHQ
jgi:hypothetical protein